MGYEVEKIDVSGADGVLEVRQNNMRQWASAFDKAVALALEEIGLTAEGYAKKACPVDTGRLRNSITHLVSGREGSREVYIGTNVEYAPYVEEGTVHMAAQPFLKPAAEGHAGTYRSILKSRMGG